jgi:hypothetical protein
MYQQQSNARITKSQYVESDTARPAADKERLRGKAADVLSQIRIERIRPGTAQVKVSFRMTRLPSSCWLNEKKNFFSFSTHQDCTSDARICLKTLTIASCRRIRKTYSGDDSPCYSTPRRASTTADHRASSSSYRVRSPHLTTLCLNIPPSTRTRCRFHRSRRLLTTVMTGE